MPWNDVDEIMRLPATDFSGPKDSRLDRIIAYIRQIQVKHEKAKRSEIADLDLPEVDGHTKPKAYRRM